MYFLILFNEIEEPQNASRDEKNYSESLQNQVQQPPSDQQIQINQNSIEHAAVRYEETMKYNSMAKEQYKLIDTDIREEQQKNYECVIDIGDITYFEKQDIVKEQNQHNQQNQQIQTFLQWENTTANQIINQKFYQPSFKQRKVEDEYLKKFIREFYDIQKYQEEYNLDGSQEELLNHQISKFVPIRGDGNCMFTSIGFQYLYYKIIDEGRYQRLLKLIDQTEFKQKYENQEVASEKEQVILKQEFNNQLQELKKKQLEIFTQIKDKQQQLFQMLLELEKTINNHDGPLYGLMVIFLRNYFRKILQDFYDNDEMNWQIQNPEQINELITWEFMYDEADIALKLFAQKEQIFIKCFSKLNVEDKTVGILDYHDENQKEFPYKIGLAFQPGHYNAILLKN